MKNQAKLKEWELGEWITRPPKEEGGDSTEEWRGAERYYYLRFGKGALKVPDGFLGVATVCLIPFRSCAEGVMGYVRGISFCNPKDQFIKKKGRAIALGRAIKAYQHGETSEPIPWKTPAGILHTQGYMPFFSEFNPELIEYEQRLFASKAEEKI